MAKYLLVYDLRITDTDGTAEQSCELTVNCEPDELQRTIALHKQGIQSKLDRKLNSGEEGFVLLKQVLPL